MPAARLITAPALVLALAFALDAQQPEPPKAVPPPKAANGVKLPDGTYLWTGDTLPDTVTLAPQELQKLLDQVEQMRKQLAARKAVAPSGCAIRGKVEKRGDTAVVALKVTYAFRTTATRSAVALGGRRGFLVGASLDGGKLPVLDAGDDGFAVMVDAPGDHSLTLDLEAPVVGRGAKTEVGFDLGLPRAAITTLSLELPPEIKSVGLVTRTPDPTQPTKTPETRRVPSLDVKRLSPRSPSEPAYPLGPVDQLEVSWEPPATTSPPAESVRAAEFDIAAVVDDATVETSARVKLKGPSREWRLVTPPGAEVSVERAAGAPAELGPVQQPVVTKPGDAARPVWKIELPGSAGDWVVVATAKQPRPKASREPFAVGPFAVLDVFRQSGTVRATAAAHTRFVAKHGPELRQGEVPNPEDDRTTILFKLSTGPTGGSPSFAPLLTLEAHALQSAVRVKPTYRLRLAEAGWRVRAELRVVPIRRDVDAVTIEVPAEWGTLEASPAEMVNSVEQLKDGPRRTIEVRLANAQKQPFDVVLDATVPVPAGVREFGVPLLRFPGSEEREAALTAAVADGLEVRGTAREWAGEQPLGWGQPLTAASGAEAKTKAVTTIGGKFEGGLARADLAWHPYRPDLSAEVRADVTVHDRQIVVAQQFKLKAADAFTPRVRFKAPAGATGLKSSPPLDPAAPGEWSLVAPADAKDATVSVTFALPLPPGEVRKATVGLVQIPAATRTETRVRVWSNALVGRTITADLGAWRELPSEPAVERDALPALTVAGTGPDQPLVLELRDGVDPAAVAVWVERAAVQVSAADDGGAAFRARFLLKRWLAGAVEVRVPVISAATNPEFQIDGKRVEFATTTEERTYRVPLPEARPGRTAVLDVRYTVPANRPGGASLYSPPTLAATAFAGPVRWLIALPPGAIPLTSDAARVEVKWRWRGWLFHPTAGSTADELDRWFRTGTEPAVADGDALLAQQSVPEPLRVRRADGLGFVAGCSLAAFAVGWLATRTKGNRGGLVVAGLAAVAAAGAMLEPLAASQVAAAVQPGVAALVLTLAALAGFRWYHRNAVTYLPGFTRRPVELEPSSVRPSRGGESTGSLVPIGDKPA